MRHSENTAIMKKSKLQGSLTIEAALVLPLFLLGFLMLLSIFSLVGIRLRLSHCLNDACKEYALKASDGLSISYRDIMESVRERFGTFSTGLCRIDGGIDMSSSYLDNPEFIELRADYVVIPFGWIMDIGAINVSQCAVMHTWTGYRNGYFPGGDIDITEYVYVTEGTEVYHRSRECSHILLRVTATDAKTVRKQRNSDGGRYKSCSHCHSSLGDEILYITPEGSCYHNSLSCSGLRRSVRVIPISEATGLRPCSRCGY